MKLFKAIIVIFCLGFILGCSSDNDGNGGNNPPTGFQNILDFNLTLGGTKNESAQAVVKTNDGGFAVLGYTQSMDGDVTGKTNESFDYWVCKFNNEGSMLWNKTYGGTNDDRGNDIIQTQDGGFAILGFSQSNDGDASENFGFQDYWIAKLDASGNLLWQKSFGYSGGDNGVTLIQTSDLGYLLVGLLDVTASGGEGNSRNNARHAGGDYWAIKLDALGNKQWSRYFGGTFTDTPYDVVETPDNAFIIAGSSDSEDFNISNNKGTYDFWIIKISNTGDLIWEKSFGGEEIDEARAITESGDGNFLLVGDTRSSDQDVSFNKGAADLWLVKITPEGTILWEKTFGGISFDVGRGVDRTSDNGFLICGSSRSVDGDLDHNYGQNDAWVFKVNTDGILQWSHTYGGSDIDFYYDVVELDNKHVVAVGESNSADFDILENKGFTDLLITKIK